MRIGKIKHDSAKALKHKKNYTFILVIRRQRERERGGWVICRVQVLNPLKLGKFSKLACQESEKYVPGKEFNHMSGKSLRFNKFAPLSSIIKKIASITLILTKCTNIIGHQSAKTARSVKFFIQRKTALKNLPHLADLAGTANYFLIIDQRSLKIGKIHLLN